MIYIQKGCTFLTINWTLDEERAKGGDNFNRALQWTHIQNENEMESINAQEPLKGSISLWPVWLEASLYNNPATLGTQSYHALQRKHRNCVYHSLNLTPVLEATPLKFWSLN